MNRTELIAKRQPAKLDTMALILQALKMIFQEAYDDLQGTGAYRHEQKFHINALCKLFDRDIANLYKLIQDHGDGMEINRPLYDAIDLMKEVIQTTAELSQQQNPEGGTVGIPLMRQILKEIRAGNWMAVDELPGKETPCNQPPISVS